MFFHAVSMTFQDFMHKHIVFVVYLSALLGLLDPKFVRKFGVNLSSVTTGNNMRQFWQIYIVSDQKVWGQLFKINVVS